MHLRSATQSGQRFRNRSAAAGSAVALTILAILLTSALPACQRSARKQAETAYVSVPQANLRDRVAAVYNKTGAVHNGEPVEVLDKTRRFVKVKTGRGEIGWIEERYLVGADVYSQLEKLAAGNAGAPVQARGTTRASLNMHVTPGRETEHLYQMPEGAKVAVLRRETAEKPESVARPAALVRSETPRRPTKAGGAAESQPPREDWLLVRDQSRHTGWVLARMVDLDVPLDIAQYSEGQRIVAYFVLNEVADAEKKVPQYLVLLTGNKDGLPWDFDQARIFTWNVKRHRYETAYRERKLIGVLPATVGTADFGKDGLLPTFTLRVRGDDGKLVEKQYKLMGPIVRRVLSPEEERAQAAQKSTPRKRRRR